MDPSVSSDLILQIFLTGFLQNSGLIVLVLLLLVCSALISSSEVALFSLSPSQKEELREAKDSTSQRIISMLEYPDKEEAPRRLLASILIANNAVNIMIVLLCTQLSETFFPPDEYAELTIFMINVVAITFVLVLFGEVIPKVYATGNNMKTSRFMAMPIWAIRYIMKPFALFLMSTSKLLENQLRKRSSSNISVDELGHALELTADDNRSEEEHKILEGIVTFGAKEVGQIMTARTDIIGVYEHSTSSEVMTTILEKGYSRMPVFGTSSDDIKGFLFIKDFLPYLDESDFGWQKLVRAPFYVPENKKIDDLLQQFKQEKIHMAVVVDEYGGTSGLVTLEDILEEIVGDIHDEFDTEELHYSKLDERNFVFEGKISLVDMYKILELEDESLFEEAKGDSGSLGGFIIEQAGKIPSPGEKLQFHGYQFRIEAADKRRIKRIKVTLPQITI